MKFNQFPSSNSAWKLGFCLYNKYIGYKEKNTCFYCLFGIYEETFLPSHYIYWFNEHKKDKMTKLTFMSVFSHMSNVNGHLWPDKRFPTLDLGVLSERLAYTGLHNPQQSL